MKLRFLNVCFVKIEAFLILYGLQVVCAISGFDRSCTHTPLQKTLQGDDTWKYFCQYVKGQNRIILLQGSEFNHKCSTCKCSQNGLECCQPNPPKAPPGCVTVGTDCDFRQVMTSDRTIPCDLNRKPNIDLGTAGNNLTSLLNSKDAFVFFSTNTQISKHQEQGALQQTPKKDSENESPDFPFSKYFNLLMSDGSNPQGNIQGYPQGQNQGNPQSQYQGYLQNQPQVFQPTNSQGMTQGYSENSQAGNGPETNVKKLETNSVQIVAAQPDKIDLDFTTFVQNVLALSGNDLTNAKHTSLLKGKPSEVNSFKHALESGFTDPQRSVSHMNRKKSNRPSIGQRLSNTQHGSFLERKASTVNLDRQSLNTGSRAEQQKSPLSGKTVNSGRRSGKRAFGKTQQPQSPDRKEFSVNYDIISHASRKPDLQRRHGKEAAISSSKKSFGKGFPHSQSKISPNRKNNEHNLQETIPFSSKTAAMHLNTQSVVSDMTNAQQISSTNTRAFTDVTELFNARSAIERPEVVLGNGKSPRHLNIKPIRKTELSDKYLLPSEYKRLSHLPDRLDIAGAFDAITETPVSFEPPITTTVTVTFDPLEHLVTSGNMQITTMGPFDSSTNMPIRYAKNSQKHMDFQQQEARLNDIRKISSNDGQFSPGMSRRKLGHITRNGENDVHTNPLVIPLEKSSNIENLSVQDSLSLLLALEKIERKNNNKKPVYANKPNFQNENTNILGSDKYRKQPKIQKENFNRGDTTLHQYQPIKRGQNFNMVSPINQNKNQQPISGADFDLNLLANLLSSGSVESSKRMRDIDLSNSKRNNMEQKWQTQNSKPFNSNVGTSVDSTLSDIVDKMVRQKMMQFIMKEKQTSIQVSNIDQTGAQNLNNLADKRSGGADTLANLVDKMVQQKMMQFLFQEKQTNPPSTLNLNKPVGSNTEMVSNINTNTQMDSSNSQQLLLKMLMNPEGPTEGPPEGLQSQMAVMSMFNNNMFPAPEGPQAMSENLPMSMMLRMNSETPFSLPMQGMLHTLQ